MYWLIHIVFGKAFVKIASGVGRALAPGY